MTRHVLFGRPSETRTRECLDGKIVESENRMGAGVVCGKTSAPCVIVNRVSFRFLRGMGFAFEIENSVIEFSPFNIRKSEPSDRFVTSFSPAIGYRFTGTRSHQVTSRNFILYLLLPIRARNVAFSFQTTSIKVPVYGGFFRFYFKQHSRI